MSRASFLLALVGCYHPSFSEGAPCITSADCPAPLTCNGSTCISGDGGLEIDAHPDADLACSCGATGSLSCPTGETACPAGCTTSGGPHCLVVQPSNGVTAMFPPSDTPTTTIALITTFDTDDGTITGGIDRDPGSGIVDGIGFSTQTSGSASLGVFSFNQLVVSPGGTVRFTGNRAAVFIVAGSAMIVGTIDGSGGCYGLDRSCGGPGGGTGGTFSTLGSGCGKAYPGLNDTATGASTGGGGGGGNGLGGRGGNETISTGSLHFNGGGGGTGCIVASLEPLVGGGGGGGGGPGLAASQKYGGGGGGAFQLTAFDTIDVSGVINMGGAGGDTGTTNASDAGAGCGGGAGGGILLEAPTMIIEASAVLAANGGGGGGGSGLLVAGSPGQNGKAGAVPAAGGAGSNTMNAGGNGGAATIAGKAGADVTDVNSGGGGGTVGRIFIRSLLPLSNLGLVSPSAGTGTIRTM